MTTLPHLKDALVTAAAQRDQPGRRRDAIAAGQTALLPRLRSDLIDAAQRRQGKPRRSRAALIAVAAAFVLAAAVATAAGLWPTGTSVPKASFPLADGNGILNVPSGSHARLLALRAADPDGGPPWGLRTFRATGRATGRLDCVQVGRVQDGNLGVLGLDGVFADDHKFHPLPLAPDSCSGGLPTASSGNLQVATVLDKSGYSGRPMLSQCETAQERYTRVTERPRTLRAALRHQLAHGYTHAATVQRRLMRKADEAAREQRTPCPAQDLRNVVYGQVANAETTASLLVRGRPPRQIETDPQTGRFLLVLRGGRDALQRARITFADGRAHCTATVTLAKPIIRC